MANNNIKAEKYVRGKGFVHEKEGGSHKIFKDDAGKKIAVSRGKLSDDDLKRIMREADRGGI